MNIFRRVVKLILVWSIIRVIVLDDFSDQVRSVSGESVLHYVLWSLLVAVLLAEFVIFSPSLMNVRNPDLDSNWKMQQHKVIKQIEKDVE